MTVSKLQHAVVEAERERDLGGDEQLHNHVSGVQSGIVNLFIILYINGKAVYCICS